MGDSSGGGPYLKLDESDTMQLVRQAVLFENEELLSDLLRENPWAVLRVDRHGRTPLMLAAHNGRTSSLRVLLRANPDSIDVANQAGKTALHLSAEAGEGSTAKALIEAGADIFLRDEAGHCALEGAHMAGHENVAAVLIEAVQFENQKADEAHKRLIEACIEGSSTTVDEILASTSERDIDVVLNGRAQDDNSSLFIACTNGHPEVVRRLLAKSGHVLVNAMTKDTILHSAVSSQSEEVLRLVLETFPALIANSNCDGASPLHWAAQSGHVGIVKLLLNFEYPPSCVKEIDMVSAPPYHHAIDMNQGDTECRTALYYAVAKSHQEIVQEFLHYECSFLDGSMRCPFQIDVYCSRGRTPLMVAAFNQSLPILGTLLDKGSDVNLPLGIFENEVSGEDTRIVGSGALVEATRADAVHVVHYLLDRGALDTGNRALQLAASNANEKLIRVYLTRLVFPDSENKVNKKNVDVGQIQVGQNLLPSALCPSRAAMLNWAGSNLETVQPEWFISAALQVNPRLRTTRLSLAAITRVDLSSNRLNLFPSALFQMPILNLSDNRLSKIDLPSYYVSSTSLEVLLLKGNKLETISAPFLAAFPLLNQLDLSFNEISLLPEHIWLCPSLNELNVANNLLSSLPMVGMTRGRGTPRLQPGLADRPPDAVGDLTLEDPPNVESKPLLRQNVWQTAISLSKVDDEDLFPDFPVTSSSTLTTLNLSNNKFQAYPFCLACTCPRLLTLNLSGNQLATLPPIACIPAHLRALDVSNNELTAGFQPPTPFHTVCHAVPPSSNAAGLVRRQSPQRQHRSRSKSAVRSQRSLSVSRHQQPESQLEEACVHKRHDSLLWLKTLNIGNNQLVDLKVVSRGKVLVPALNVLDLSNNTLKAVSSDLSKLSALSVLNLSGNKEVKELPPDLGMLSRLWSLSLKGCHLRDPLDSMVNTENCKTMDIVAYLKTILEESKLYRHLRLLILGGDVVGKSTIWNGLRNEAIQKDFKGRNVMVSEWKYEIKKKAEGANGPVTVSAWDFCGQREYYSTYQYFLTRRAIYVVVFRITDGDTALGDVQKWLVSIQARAPNSSVILVATMTDQVTAHPNRFPSGYLEDLEDKIRMRFFVTDADKRGLPKLVDLLFINAKTKQDVKLLLNSIYRNVWDVRVGKEKALEQHIPSSYIALLKATREMAMEHNKEGKDCVISVEHFKNNITKKMEKYGRPFRDDVEFYAACAFLHESGELVHFEDAALRQIVFFDPLWLADFLAIYVGLRSPSFPSGLLTQDTVVEKTMKYKRKLRACIIDLIHKFELALVLHSRLLLVPGLLPDEYILRSNYQSSAVKVSTKMSSWTIRHPTPTHVSLRPTMSILGRSAEENSPKHKPLTRAAGEPIFHFAYNSEHQLRRLYVMAYVPAGFWGRLITRIIGDQNVSVAVEGLFSAESPRESSHMKMAIDGRLKAEWLVWQTGIEMLVKGHSLFVLKQFLPLAEVRNVDYSTLTIQTKDDQKRWRPFPVSEWAVLEMLFPSLIVTSTAVDGEKHSMKTDPEGTTRLMALVIDLVDTLLEDWYPGLGTRFVHTSEGELLVSRLVPCPICIKDSVGQAKRSHDDSEIGTRERKDSSTVRSSQTTGNLKTAGIVNCFSVEECMLAGREFGWVECPSHGGVHMKQVAPDTVFVDIENSMVILSEHIKRGRMLGRGAFGFVFRATVKLPSGELSEVAQKMLEPVDPGTGGRPSAVAAFKAAADKWRRDSLEFACRAYCTSRQELNLLSRMRHPNVLSLLGVCIQPLSLVVELAPLGALNFLLTSHRKSGSKLTMSVIRETAMQVAKALEYLHSAHIIYRDMKSENVLVWRFPPPFSPQTDVLVKLGDYGISRSVLPSGGAKGFGGTEGFMAPEMVRFNGEEEYTQKVDVFSFGMFLYELITLKQPFEGEEHVKERLLEGARPVLLPHELLVPCSMLDLLVQCWETQPEQRPSSSQLVGFCTAPEFAHILDVCETSENIPPNCVLPVFTADDLDEPEDFEAQLWISGTNIDVLACTQYAWVDNKTITMSSQPKFMAKIRDTIWVCENDGGVTVFSTSLHELAQLNLPSLSAPMIRAPQLLPGDVLLLVTQREIVLLGLSESNSVSLRARMQSPYPITAAVYVPATSSRQIWTGHEDGRITIHHLSNDDTFSFSSSLYLVDTEAVVKEFVANSTGSNVWVTLENSSRISCYDVERRQMVASLDIRKVMPGSETILTLDEDVASNTYVTTICLLERTHGSQLYIGSSKGLFIVAHANGMQPISACRPFAGELVSLCVIEGSVKDDDGSIRLRNNLSTTSTESGLSWVRERVNETVERFRSSPAVSIHLPVVVAAIGKGFRSLSHRFVAETTLPEAYSAVIWTTEEWE